MRFSAIFVREEDGEDGVNTVEVGNGYGLSAETLDDAVDEALALSAPAGANAVKILDEGRVVRWLGFDA